MENVINLDVSNFKEEIKNSNLPVVVDFWATWCGPCRKLSPIIDEIAQEYSGKVKFAKFNIEDGVDIAKEYSISGIPCLLIFKNGETVERMTGIMPKSTIISNIEKYV